jgi:hypothetical protein
VSLPVYLETIKPERDEDGCATLRVAASVFVLEYSSSTSALSSYLKKHKEFSQIFCKSTQCPVFITAGTQRHKACNSHTDTDTSGRSEISREPVRQRDSLAASTQPKAMSVRVYPAHGVERVSLCHTCFRALCAITLRTEKIREVLMILGTSFAVSPALPSTILHGDLSSISRYAKVGNAYILLRNTKHVSVFRR